MTFEVDLETGEKLELPKNLIENLGAGKWLVTIQPKTVEQIKNHSAFLNSYAEDDEGLYDDLSEPVICGWRKSLLQMVQHRKNVLF